MNIGDFIDCFNDTDWLLHRMGTIFTKVLITSVFIGLALKDFEFSHKILFFLVLYGLGSILGYFIKRTGNYYIGSLLMIIFIVFFLCGFGGYIPEWMNILTAVIIFCGAAIVDTLCIINFIRLKIQGE